MKVTARNVCVTVKSPDRVFRNLEYLLPLLFFEKFSLPGSVNWGSALAPVSSVPMGVVVVAVFVAGVPGFAWMEESEAQEEDEVAGEAGGRQG